MQMDEYALFISGFKAWVPSGPGHLASTPSLTNTGEHLGSPFATGEETLDQTAVSLNSPFSSN